MVEIKVAVSILPGNRAFHKIKIANTPLTEKHIIPLCHHKKAPARVIESYKLQSKFTASQKEK